MRALVKSINEPGTEHVHRHHQITLGLTGHVDFRIGDQLAAVSSVLGCIVPADISHYFAGSDGKVLVIDINKEDLQTVYGVDSSIVIPQEGCSSPDDLQNELFSQPRYFPVNYHFRKLYTCCARELGRFADVRTMQHISSLLIRGIGHRFDNEQHQLDRGKIDLERLRNWVVKNLSRKITVAELASMSFMSSSHFHACFLASTGKTPYQFVLETRLQQASNSVRTTNNPFSRIADEVGFSSQSAMTNSFQKHFGLSPLKMRQRYTNRLK